MLSLFRNVLGARIDALAPVLRRHYDLPHDTTMTARGSMDIENRYPALRLAASFLPAAGKGVDITLINRSYIDSRGRPCLEWRRVFSYPGRTMESFSINRPAPRPLMMPSILDYFTRHRGPTLGVTLMVQPSKDGDAMAHISVGNQYLMIGEKLLPQPWGARVKVESVEHAVDRDSYYTDVKVSHPIFGLICRYSGQLTIQA